jgi:hypothetical protein
MIMEAASTPETSVNFYQTTRSNIPEDRHLHTSHRENAKSHLIICFKFVGNGAEEEVDLENV